MDRRQLLRSALAGGGLAALAPLLGRLPHREAMAQAALAGISYDAGPFTLGVASGDPRPEAVVLWTRLAPEPLTAGGGLDRVDEVALDWIVAADPRLRRVVRRGTVMAHPQDAHAVHVEVDGLEPGQTYWYRFAVRGRVSRIGRTRTAPAGPTSRLRLGWVSCADLPSGFYAAYRRLAQEDLDVVACLGDYIYESGGDGQGRAHTGGQTVTLDEYRIRHALYKGDPSLRAAHAAFPWVFTWDDHEVDNNYAGLVPENGEAAEGNDSTAAFAARRGAAYRAYYEHLPLSLTVEGPPSTDPARPDFRIHKRLAFGDLLDLAILDTRQFRSDQPCDDGAFQVLCDEVDDPARTMLGSSQKAWLEELLTGSSARWRILLSSVMVAPWQVRQGLPEDADEALLGGLGLVPVDDAHRVNADQWDGYTAERAELLRFVADQGIEDVVVLVGDLHSTWVNDLRLDFDDPLAPVVASEFVGTSVTTPFPVPRANAGFRQATMASNPHVREFEGESHGYGVVTVGPDALDVDYRGIGDASDARATASTTSSWRVQRGTPGPRRR